MFNPEEVCILWWVVGSVKKAMHSKCQEHSLSFNIDLQSQLDLKLIELVDLISFNQDGTNLNDKGYLKEALSVS